MELPRINYTNRDYNTIYTTIKSLIPRLTPNWTDFNESDLGMVIVELFCGVADMLNFYIDMRAGESFLNTAILRQSVIDLVQLIDYQLSRPVSSTTKVRFSLSSPAVAKITIPKYTTITTSTSLPFVTKEEVSINIGQTSIEVIAYQGQAEIVDTLLGNGEAVQEITLPYLDVSANMFEVYVNNVLWAEDTGQALDPDNYNVYQVLTNWQGFSTIRFSSARGNVPSSADIIYIRCLTTVGESGNLSGSSYVCTIANPTLVVAGVEAEIIEPAVGGASAETMQQAKSRAPVSIRALHRAVTGEDYEFFALRFLGGNSKARAEKGYPSWKNVNLYVAPQDGGEVTETLKNEILTYFENKKDPTVELTVLPHVFVNVRLSATIYIPNTMYKATVGSAVQEAISNYFSFSNQDFGGKPSIDNPADRGVFISDLYSIISDVAGVGRVMITNLQREKIVDGSPVWDTASLALDFASNEIPTLVTNGVSLTIEGGM